MKRFKIFETQDLDGFKIIDSKTRRPAPGMLSGIHGSREGAEESIDRFYRKEREAEDAARAKAEGEGN